MTNFEKVKTLNEQELSELIRGDTVCCEISANECRGMSCVECCSKWLNKEATND